MTWFMTDVEADGPIPGTDDYSMISLGIVRIDEKMEMNETFYGELKPISEKWIPEALAVSGFTREETLKFDDPKEVLRECVDWLKETSHGQPRFISDNNGFDWMFCCWYLHHFLGHNPFGYSSTNLGSLYKGMVKDMRKNFKHLRKTKHDHNPVNDSKGNVEAIFEMKKQGLIFPL